MRSQGKINKNKAADQTQRRRYGWFAGALCIFLAVWTLPTLAAPRQHSTRVKTNTNTNAASGDETAIRTLEQNLSDGVHAGDVDKIMANYQHERALASYDFDRRQESLGWDAYRNDWQHFLSKFTGPITFQIYDMNITTAGNVAYGHGYQHVAGRTINGKPVDFVLRITDVYRKADGKWLITAEHVSVPVDMSTGTAHLQRLP